jgi:Methyltransferase domain
MNPRIIQVQRNIEKIINYLEKRSKFLNMHMVPWICENLWKNFTPTEIQQEIENVQDVKTAMEVFFKQEKADPELLIKHQNFYRYIQKEKEYYLENLEDKLFLTHEELFAEFRRLDIPINCGLTFNVKEFMKDKKNYEVKLISVIKRRKKIPRNFQIVINNFIKLQNIVGNLARARGKQHFIVDYGDGKGYLSARLALEYGLQVLGIDGSLNNSIQAEIRNEKLSKKWIHLVSNEAKRNNVEVPSEVSESAINVKNYQTIPSMIYGDTDLNELIHQYYEKDVGDICLTGLHTCGNLASNSLKHFVKNDKIKIICNVPCCYHLLYEEFHIDYFNDEPREFPPGHPDDYGFPLSNFLRNKKFSFGRNCRMLATQSYERVINGQSEPDPSLFYRAVFEKLLRERWTPKNEKPKMLRLGKIKRYKNLEEYLRKGCKKFNIDFDLTSDELIKLEKDHEMDKELINLNYYIRILVSKTLEGLINLDRLLFLLEHNYQKVYLVKIFDPLLSPRNYGIISIKD